MELYDSITEEELNNYAEKAGLGGVFPVDLIEFEKYLRPNSKILEVGCGTGRLGKHLIKKYDYTGIDKYEKYVEYFKDTLVKKETESRRLINVSFREFRSSNNFDAVIFPWSVISEFDKNEQLAALIKAKKLLTENGVVLIDNPAKESVKNTHPNYKPVEFYFEEWEDTLKGLGFKVECFKYKTTTNRVRELVVLKN